MKINREKLVRNILIAAGAGILVGLIMGLVSSATGINFGTSTAAVGVVIGITFVALNNQKEA